MKQHVKRMAENVASRVAPLIWHARRTPRLMVLMYHRVLPPEHPDSAIEQPGMFVSPTTLDMHLHVLKRHFEVVHLNDWVRRAAAGQPLPPLACALTFDDGWRDNFDYAFPLLRRHGAPATIFPVSALIGTHNEFWPNRLGRLLISAPPGKVLPGRLGEVLTPVLRRAQGRGALNRDDVDWAIGLAKQLGETEIHALLDVAYGGELSTTNRAVLNQEEMRAMAASGLVRFGSHTRTHYRLRGEVSSEVLRQEIELSREEVAATAGQAADVFCYPNGDTTTAAVDFVRRHYVAAVTTRAGWHTPAADPYLIRRIGVHEDVGNRPAAFLTRISGWL